MTNVSDIYTNRAWQPYRNPKKIAPHVAYVRQNGKTQIAALELMRATSRIDGDWDDAGVELDFCLIFAPPDWFALVRTG